MKKSPLGKTPARVRTFRVRGMGLCKEIVDGLINHRQWFTFRPLIDPTTFSDEYEFDFDPETPESGYGFTPTREVETYENNPGEYGLELTSIREHKNDL